MVHASFCLGSLLLVHHSSLLVHHCMQLDIDITAVHH